MAITLAELLTVAEAAARSNVHPASMRRAVREGRVAGRRVGRDWLVEVSSLAAYSPIRKPKRSRPPEAI